MTNAPVNMTHQIRLEKWKTTKDSSGNNVEGQIKYNLWAHVQDMSGMRTTVDGQSELLTVFKFTIYFRPLFKISGNWKIIYNGSRFHILNISQLNEQRFYWVITAQKIDMN